jgi:dihydroneopterin aldolase
MDRITLRSMRLEGRVGATEEERSQPQALEVDLVVEADLAAAASSDDLASTVDYGPLARLAEETVSTGTFTLLEALAGALATAALEASPRILAVTVRVRKLAVPLEVWMEHAEVELRRER